MNELDWTLAIVHRAVLDWRKLIMAKAWNRDYYHRISNEDRVPNNLCNFEELRRFFKGDWCELILECNQASVSASKILSILERELAEAIEAEEAVRNLVEAH